MTNLIGSSTVTQVGLVVRDIEKTIDQYVKVFGLSERPQVSLTGTLEEAHTNFRGQSSEARAKLAFIPMGQVTIELIEPVGRPSTWGEFLDTHGEGVHHIAFQIKDTGQVVTLLQGQGLPLDQQGEYPGGMYTYINSAPQLAVTLELLENF